MGHKALAVVVSVVLCGCSHDLGTVERPCDPGGKCPAGQRCINNICITAPPPDSGDAAPRDLALEAAAPDLKVVEDQPRPDQAPDKSGDQGQPDAPAPDQAQADQAQADQAQADQALADQAPADQALPDQALADQVSPDQVSPDQTPACQHPSVTKSCAVDTNITKAKISFCTIKSGCFQMGSPTTENCRVATNEDRHPVTLTHDFYIMEKEVTQTEYVTFVPNGNPSKTQAANNPVENLTWHVAAYFCNQLTAKAADRCYSCTVTSVATCKESAAYSGSKFYDCPGYRLPTEAEWEYAYRAGTATAMYNGAVTTSCAGGLCNNASLIGWYKALPAPTHVGGQKTANAWGLRDMAGNVHEWVHDGYQQNLGLGAVTDPVQTGAERVYRGGSYLDDARFMRAASRYKYLPSVYKPNIGLRCVRSKP